MLSRFYSIVKTALDNDFKRTTTYAKSCMFLVMEVFVVTEILGLKLLIWSLVTVLDVINLVFSHFRLQQLEFRSRVTRHKTSGKISGVREFQVWAYSQIRNPSLEREQIPGLFVGVS